MLPKRDGLTVLRSLRERDRELPALILSAKGQENNKVEGLRAGADDYLAKPFGLDELMARIEALLRRSGHLDTTLSFDRLTIDFDNRSVRPKGEDVQLSRKKLEILLFLVRNRARIVTREQILERVWGYAPASNARSVDFHILNLRRKLEDDPKQPRYIVTRHGLGFQFAAKE